MTARRERALAALLTHSTIRGAAVSAGVSEATLHRWLGTPVFRRALEAKRAQALLHTTSRLQGIVATAVTTLETVMEDTAATASARVSAARTVLEFCARTGIEEKQKALEPAARSKEADDAREWVRARIARLAAAKDADDACTVS